MKVAVSAASCSLKESKRTAASLGKSLFSLLTFPMYVCQKARHYGFLKEHI